MVQPLKQVVGLDFQMFSPIMVIDNSSRKAICMYYILRDGEPVPVNDVLEWSRWIEDDPAFDKRRIARTKVSEDVEVSTVFLGLDHSFLPGATPILFETLVFGGERDGEMERYCTLEDAMQGHERMLALVRGE